MRITDEDVHNCTDRDTLADMLDECVGAIDDMKLQIKVRRDLDTATDDWLARVSSAVFHNERVAGLIRDRLGEGDGR